VLCQPELVRSLHTAGFSQPSPVQQSAVPLGRFGADLIVQACSCARDVCAWGAEHPSRAQAKSGTGKTVTFGIIILDALNAALAAPQALVVEPTREVALQVQRTIAALCKELPLQARNTGASLRGFH
jgi:superfamily II DNA/RNA helicase